MAALYMMESLNVKNTSAASNKTTTNYVVWPRKLTYIKYGSRSYTFWQEIPQLTNDVIIIMYRRNRELLVIGETVN